MSERLLAIVSLAALVTLGHAMAVHAQAPAAVAAASHNDYSDPATWLCRPGREDACTVNLDATVIAADGTTNIDHFHADPHAAIDCFYVYPTVSRDPGANATMAIEPAETGVVQQQFARFAAHCRLYAPMYRQVTLTSLAARMAGKPMAGANRDMAYDDVVDAWNEYLSHDNHGRGVVLIGHSQGSGVLTRLIAAEIDGKPLQRRLVSAILMGTTLQVPPGKDVGGAFKTIPLCHSATELGCVIAFADFRADSPPPATSFFGRGDKTKRTVAACVNPAALAGGGELEAFMPTHAPIVAEAANVAPSWTNPPTQIDTLFVELPGLLTAQCVSDEHGDYLAVTVHPTVGGRRVNDIVGDVVIGGQVQRDWGLHLVDANLNMGNLVSIVGEESRAYVARAGE